MLLNYYMFYRYKDMEVCIILLFDVSSVKDIVGGFLEKWFECVFVIFFRIVSNFILGIIYEKFREDNELWKDKVVCYKKFVSFLL